MDLQQWVQESKLGLPSAICSACGYMNTYFIMLVIQAIIKGLVAVI